MLRMARWCLREKSSEEKVGRQGKLTGMTAKRRDLNKGPPSSGGGRDKRYMDLRSRVRRWVLPPADPPSTRPKGIIIQSSFIHTHNLHPDRLACSSSCSRSYLRLKRLELVPVVIL